MAIPVLLGLLATQGARTIATRIAGSAATRRKVANILKRNFQKAQKESLGKGKIPSEKTLTKGLTKDQKGLLSNLNPTPARTSQGSTTFNSPILTEAERKAAAEAAKYTYQGPIPNAAGRTAAQRVQGETAAQARTVDAARRRAAQNARVQGETAAQARTVEGAIKGRQAAYGRNPITQTKDAGLTTRETLGLLGGVTTVPLIGGAIGGFVNQETPQVAATGVPMGQTGPQAPRFMQVINPGYESTGKEVLNAALLRAGLRMASGGNLRETLDAAASVADSKNIFRSGEQALAAGRRNLGEAAQITVGQNADGTFSYRGTLDANPVAQMDAIVNETQKREGKKPSMITKQILDVAMRANPSKSEEEVIAELVKAGWTNPTQ